MNEVCMMFVNYIFTVPTVFRLLKNPTKVLSVVVNMKSVNYIFTVPTVFTLPKNQNKVLSLVKHLKSITCIVLYHSEA